MDFLKKPTALIVAVAIGITSLIGLGVYISSSGNDDRAQPSAYKVEVAQARKGSLVREMTVVGTLESANSVVMKAQVKGLVTKVNIVGGEDVDKGDILFEIDPRSYSARAKEAQALHNLAKAALEREEKLAEKNFGAAKKLEEARAQFLKTQAQLESAQKDLEDTKITAPFDGVVGLHRISVGTPISADLDLVTITDTDPMKVNFKMPSKFVRYLSLDQKVSIEVDSYPGRKFVGRIEAIDALVDAGAQSIAVQATIPNTQNLLKPGMFVRVKVTVGSKDNSLIVPEESIVSVGDQTYVWKVIEHPEKPGLFIVFRVEVLTGIQEKDRMEITRNLRENDIVVTVGHQKIANGVPVTFDKDMVDLGDDEAVEEATEDQATEKAAEDKNSESDNKADTADKDSPSLWQRIKGIFSSDKNEDAEEKAPTSDNSDTSETKDESEEKAEQKSDQQPEQKSENEASEDASGESQVSESKPSDADETENKKPE